MPQARAKIAELKNAEGVLEYVAETCVKQEYSGRSYGATTYDYFRGDLGVELEPAPEFEVVLAFPD